jgi:hypothetical protein
MVKVLLRALAISVAACGGGGDAAIDAASLDASAQDATSTDATSPDAAIADAAPLDGAPWQLGCNPVAQTGCLASEKCTWVDHTDILGVIQCAPAGDVALGGACTIGPPGQMSGFDDCVAGSYCLGGICEEICSDAPDSCPSTSSCSTYSGLFEGAEVATGLCDFKCSPGPQTRTFDGAADCGSTGTSARTCIGWAWGSSPIEFSCVPDISSAQHGDLPDPLSPGGSPYLNSCDAGYFPWVASLADGAPDVCIAFCTPGETHAGAPDSADGVAPFPCATRGASGDGMECRYLHIFANTPDAELNDSGVCLATDLYVSDWDQDAGTADTSLPRCTDLSTAPIDTDDDGTPDTPEHRYWGCAPWPTSVAPAAPLGGFRDALEKRLRARINRR